jgi:hypothetical protein
MAIPVSFIGETYRDYGNPGEKSSFRLAVVALTAANLVAQQTAITGLWTAIEAIVLGNIAKRQVIVSDTSPDDTEVTDPLAQRENKWLVRYHDTSNRKFTAEIPTADLSQLTLGTEFLDISTGVGSTFRNEFEAVVVSPADSSAVVVDSVQFVGRRS